jgi:hypothetical protein
MRARSYLSDGGFIGDPPVGDMTPDDIAAPASDAEPAPSDALVLRKRLGEGLVTEALRFALDDDASAELSGDMRKDASGHGPSAL